MGEYADVKRKKFLYLLKKLAAIQGFEIKTGGRHQWTIRHVTWLRAFPISFRQNKVSKVYVKELEKLIVKTGACSEETFKEWVR